MAAERDEKGRWYAFPTIVMTPEGKLQEFSDNQEALRYAKSTGNFLAMPNKQAALDYAAGET